MKLVNVSQMRELEQIAINQYGIPSLLLMENAAAGFLCALEHEIGNISGKKIHVFCGKGNNGGDGFAIARMAHNKNAHVYITILFDETTAQGDAKTNLDIVKAMGIPFVSLENAPSCDIIVEAMFGTGFHGEVTGCAKDAIDYINKSDAYVASVDIPGGVCADSGKVLSTAVFADLCVTFATAKIGHMLYPGRNHYKKLMKTDIPIPREVIEDYHSGYDIIDDKKAALIPKRNDDSHKGSFGKVLAYVGSPGMTGAALLSSAAVLKSGAGMVTAAVPEPILKTCTAFPLPVMTCPLPWENGDITSKAFDLLLEKLSTQDVLLMGCGLGTSASVKETVCHLLSETDKPTVLDADGLNAVSENPEILQKKTCPLILTPHIAEFSRLSGRSIAEIKDDPISCARDFAKKYNVVLVLKDAVTIVADASDVCSMTTKANSGMATAGSGDVLAGIIAGFLAQGASLHDAAVSGVYLHAKAGMIAAEKKGEYGMTSEDLLDAVPYAFTEDVKLSSHIKEL